MDSDSEQPEKKKRRVTKACDQCRKRRIKCASYPNATIDSPCVICTEASQASSCTYSRPTRKRGPQAGKSKNMAEKCEAFERLLGHLLVTVPAIGAHIEVFFRHAANSADSPDSASPSSSSSAQATSAEQQIEAYRASSIASQLENVAPSPAPPPSSSTAKASNSSSKKKAAKKEEADSPAPSSNTSLPTPSPNVGNHPPPPPPQPHPWVQHSFPTPRAPSTSYPLPSSYPFASTSGSSPFDVPSTALHALAHAAVPDQEQAMEGVVNNPPAAPFTGGVDRTNRLDIPLLPSESIRNQLLDLYFNQVVQPYFPMLDKTLFLRWSAHLPAVPTRTTTSLPSSRLIPPSLYLAVFALASSYLPPSVAVSTHAPEVWANAARAHLWTEIEKAPNLETIQAVVVGVIVDWGAGELNRAWVLSSMGIALSINLGLHLGSRTQPDPNSLKLKTFHSALIVHTLLSLRLSRAPLIVLEDYNVAIPPVDGNEDFELWRSDKTPIELREDWSSAKGKSAISIDSPLPGNAPTRTPQAVRSASLSTFARMASLCAIGIEIVRWDVCPRRGYGNGLASGERERIELVENLKVWTDGLENGLLLGEKGGGVERLEERARWTVEMHLISSALNLKLKPHASFASTAYDPVPPALIMLHHILNRYRGLFTMYRSLPIIDFPLHTLSATLFQQNDYAPHQHDTPLKAYEELSRVFPVSKTSFEALRTKVEAHKRELGFLRGVHPTATTVPPPSSPTPAVALSEPFQAFLSYSNDLGPSANPATVLDFGSWDQTDLLFSLGLVGNPNDSMNGWGMPAEGGDQQDALPLPPLIEADFSTLEGGEHVPSLELRYPPANLGGGEGEVSMNNLVDFASTSSAPSTSTSNPMHHFDTSLFHSAPHVNPVPHHFNPMHPPSYPSANFFSQPSPGPSMLASTGATGERSTDLLTRWLDRGAVSFEGLGEGGN